MNIQNDFLRLTKSDPLVLKITALTDFLWPSFVRETSPQVKYLADHFHIDKLSRFGSELFEFLYCGGEVDPVVGLEEIELYFRAKQDGENPGLPKGYKPENALWHKILNDVALSPVYTSMAKRCVGDHFNAGNNAVCIINELSNVMQEMVENSSAVAQAMAEKAEELSETRKAFMEAMKAGQTEKAAELKQKGRELGDQIESVLENAHAENKADIDQSIQEADRKAQETESAMQSLAAGDQKGVGLKLDDLEAKRELAKRLKKNKRLMAFAKRLGALRKAWTTRKRAKKHSSSYSDIVGAKMSDQITKAFPSEIALAGTPEGRALFALKYAQKTLLTKDYEADTKQLDRGPVVIYVDISGSMAGESELWSKAIAHVVADECVKGNRLVQIHLFDTTIDQSITLDPKAPNGVDLFNFILQWFTQGGTSFNEVLKHAYSRAEFDTKADMLIITDGDCEVEDRIVRTFTNFKNENAIDVHAFCIGKKSSSLARFCDEVQLVDIHADHHSADLLQAALS